MMGAQAAGLVVDIWAQNTSLNIAAQAQKLEDAQMDLRLAQDRVASNEQASFHIEQLAETLATQRAMMAVRGGLPGAGSSGTIAAKSVANFNRDERARKLSLEFGEQNTKAQQAIGRIALAGKRAKVGADIFNKAFQQIPFSEISGSIMPKKGIPKMGKKTGILSNTTDLNEPFLGKGKY